MEDIMKKRSRLNLFFGSSLLFVICQTFTFLFIFQEKNFFRVRQITPPQISLGIALACFFGVTIVLSAIIFLIPVSKLKIALKMVFAFLFSWAIFVLLGIFLPLPLILVLCFAAGLIWVLAPVIWFHNLFLIFVLVSIGSVFGFCFSPWTVIYLFLAISVYDILAVRFGFMQWLVEKLAECQVLPAFVIPEKISDWKLNLQKISLDRMLKEKSTERGFSILGGGDVAFPLLLMVSVFFSYGFRSSLVVAIFSLIGLIATYCLFLFFLKGKGMPALPSIGFFSIIGFLTVHFVI